MNEKIINTENYLNKIKDANLDKKSEEELEESAFRLTRFPAVSAAGPCRKV